MKKIFVIATSLSLIFLLGCSNEREKVNVEKNINDTVSVEKNTNDTVIIEEANSYEEEEISDKSENIENVNNYEYEEINKISEKIDVKNYSMNVEVDNVGKRIIIFEKDGKKMYKSIFVKAKGILKLIDLENGEKLLINESI